MPRVDLDTVTFDTGSWEVTPDQVEHLAVIADGINRAIAANPSEVFLVKATPTLSAPTSTTCHCRIVVRMVALVLASSSAYPPRIHDQGYGEQYLKVLIKGPERANRRVTLRRITPL